jgi:hypothetical protein
LAEKRRKVILTALCGYGDGIQQQKIDSAKKKLNLYLYAKHPDLLQEENTASIERDFAELPKDEQIKTFASNISIDIGETAEHDKNELEIDFGRNSSTSRAIKADWNNYDVMKSRWKVLRQKIHCGDIELDNKRSSLCRGNYLEKQNFIQRISRLEAKSAKQTQR